MDDMKMKPMGDMKMKCKEGYPPEIDPGPHRSPRSAEQGFGEKAGAAAGRSSGLKIRDGGTPERKSTTTAIGRR